MPGSAPSSVWQLLQLWYGTPLKTRRVIADFSVTTASQRICQFDASRVMLQISNWGTSAIAFGENRNITATTGIILPAGSVVTLEWITDLDLQATEFWAIAASGTDAVHVVESLLVGEFAGTIAP